MTPRIFISYSSKDSEIAQFIHDELIKRGVDVFIDYRSIDDGDDFFERIAREVEERDRVLFLVSRHSVTSKWVKIELQHAFENDRPITPIALDDTAIPRPLFFVGKLHRRAFERSAEYMTRLCGVLGIEDQPTPLTPPLSPPRIQGGEQADYPNRAKPAPHVTTLRSRVLDILPPPFAWIDIPGTIGKKWTGEPYKIAKYPITNAQYKVFVDAGGYAQSKWWTEQGWQYRQQGKRTLPDYWDNKNFNRADHPVVGVSWFEAVAFCLWLSAVTGEKIRLPTDEQWQYAAQGDDGRTYPWGNEFDAKRCNTHESKIGKTTPVRQYEGQGDSPFEVVDMTGNVWEWCATDYENKSNDIRMKSELRVLRGGSWYYNQGNALAPQRERFLPGGRDSYIGFRVVLGVPLT